LQRFRRPKTRSSKLSERGIRILYAGREAVPKGAWRCRLQGYVKPGLRKEIFACFRALRSGPGRRPESPMAGLPGDPPGRPHPRERWQARGVRRATAGPPGAVHPWRDPEANIAVFYGAGRPSQCGLMGACEHPKHRPYAPLITISGMPTSEYGRCTRTYY
jgi:hypothetical protein